MGGESWRDDSFLQARLAGKMALRELRQALQVKTDWQAGLVPASQLGVKLTNACDSLAKQLALMKALSDKGRAKHLQSFLVIAFVDLSDAAFNLQLFLKGLVDDHPVSPAHSLEDSYQVMPQKA